MVHRLGYTHDGDHGRRRRGPVVRTVHAQRTHTPPVADPTPPRRSAESERPRGTGDGPSLNDGPDPTRDPARPARAYGAVWQYVALQILR